MISAGVDGRLPYMTYPERWRGPPKQPPDEFLRPAPKPLIATSRFNGLISNGPNGTRLAPPTRPISKYPPQPSIISPVNLAQHKDESSMDDIQFNAYARLFPHGNHFAPFTPYPTIYPHYAHMMRQANFPQTPVSPLESFSPTTPTGTNSSTFLSPSFSPPSILKTSQTMIKEKRSPPHTQTSQTSPNQGNFKVPSGKEGSLKHRILTRPEDSPETAPLDLQKNLEAPRKRLLATMSPPRSPKKTSITTNSSAMIRGGFAAGSLIQLANGELRRIEDMRTEDFISSAENNPELRLAESTVVRIDETNNNATITLSYNQRRTQVGVESTSDHPYFVYGQGWASCNPDKTLQCFGLKVNKLQVGDIVVSLTPREKGKPNVDQQQQQTQPLNLHNPDNAASRKRRWSAPEEDAKKGFLEID